MVGPRIYCFFASGGIKNISIRLIAEVWFALVGKIGGEDDSTKSIIKGVSELFSR